MEVEYKPSEVVKATKMAVAAVVIAGTISIAFTVRTNMLDYERGKENENFIRQLERNGYTEIAPAWLALERKSCESDNKHVFRLFRFGDNHFLAKCAPKVDFKPYIRTSYDY